MVSGPNGSSAGAERAARSVAIGALCAWLALYEWRAIAGHLALGTSAYDLSVFDYALWSLAHGHHGFVPFFGHSIFSEHFMPVLYVLTPLHWLLPSPALLLVVQPLVAATAGVLFLRLMRRDGVSTWPAVAMMLTFLLSRRTHSALSGDFYPEVFQAALTFAMVLAWTARAPVTWAVVVALLMIKEDSAIYVAGFAMFALATHRGARTRALAVLGVSIVWFALALTVFIPASRRADGLGSANPLLQSRYGSADGGPTMSTLLDHVISRKTASTLANMMYSTGLLPVAGAVWMTPALPGLVANFAAAPDSGQSGVTHHYAWPILPWLFLSAAAGAGWLHRRWPKPAGVWIALIVAATAMDNPAIQRMFSRGIPAEAAQVRAQLQRVQGTTTLAQANLIPHLPHSTSMFAIGGDVAPATTPDLVLLTTVGNLWPLTPAEVTDLLAQYRRDARYVEVESGPLFAFQLKRR